MTRDNSFGPRALISTVFGLLATGVMVTSVTGPVRAEGYGVGSATILAAPVVPVGSPVGSIRDRVVTVPRGGGLWLRLPKLQTCEIELKADANFHFFITSAEGPAAYQAWFEGRESVLPVLTRSRDAKRHVLRLNRPITSTHYLLLDQGNYPTGQFRSFVPLDVSMRVSAR